MNKSLRFMYRYFTTSRRWRRWFNAQTVMILAVAVLFYIAVSWATPVTPSQAARATAEALTLTPADLTRTPLPPDYLTNGDQTIGIALAGAALVLIVVASFFLFLPRENKG